MIGITPAAAPAGKRLLLACGNDALRALLGEQLAAVPDFAAIQTAGGGAVLSAVEAGDVAAVIVDDAIADTTPEALCCALREAGFAGPIIAIGERVDGLTGVDATLRPPIRIGDLLTSLRAALARRDQVQPDLDLGPYRFDPSGLGLVRIADGQGVRLTAKEAAILRHLRRQDGATVSREALLDAVWGYASGVTTHTVETHIYRLRRKIESNPAKPALLRTVPGGYALGEGVVP